MKIVKVEGDYCDCGCQHCEYSEWHFEIICPYKNCGTLFFEFFDPNTSKKIEVVQCEECGKKFKVELTFNYI